MFDERTNKFIEDNPSLEWLKQISEIGIVVISPDAEKYESDPNQIVISGYTDKTISRNLIVDILTDDNSFNKIKQLFENKIDFFLVLFVTEKGKHKWQHNFSKMDIVYLLKNIKDAPSIIDRYNQLMEYVSYKKYIEKTQNEYYEIKIDNINYNIPVNSFYQFLELDDNTFNKIIESENTFNKMPLSHFLYATCKFFEENKIEENYDIGDKLKNRLKEIMSSKKVDVQMLNKYLDTNDSLLEKINVDAELKNFILSDIPDKFNDLEKAIYVYIKMCKVLTYDEEYYAVNQKGPLSEKHKTIENISNITLNNNKVVCYEFNAIYSYLLHTMGIKYKNFVGKVNSRGKQSEEEFDDEFNEYSEGHTFLKFRCDNFLVKADSVTSILQGDIMQAKLNQPLRGLICENINETTKKSFSEIMNKVYRYIADREVKISQNEVGKVESFEEVVSQFISITDKLKPVDIKEKVDILINKVNSTKMNGIDAYSYLLQLRKILFTQQEQNENFKISIIRKSNENHADVISIISTRIPDENGEMIVNRYMFKPGFKLIHVSKEELQTNFDNKTMGYIEDDDPIIPGIKR